MNAGTFAKTIRGYDPMQTEAQMIQALVNRGQLARPDLASRLERAGVLAVFGHVELLDAQTARVESETRPGCWYLVRGTTCDCLDSVYGAPDGHCKHKLGVALVARVRAAQRMAAAA